MSVISDFHNIAERISRADSILCMTHIHADGDGLGSMVALAAAAGQANKTVKLFLTDKIPWRYKFLFDGEFPKAIQAEDFHALASKADLIMVIDTCSYSQLGDIDDDIKKFREKTVVIDHHSTTDDIGAVRWVDPQAGAAGLMMMELLERLDFPMPPAASLALATAIVSDTGWLRFSNTDGRAARAFAKLLDAGVNPADLYDRIYQTDRIERLRLLERVLGSMELFNDGKLAVMSLYKSDFEDIGARLDETENLINEAMRIASVEVAVMLVENPDQIRVSLRSRKDVDVAGIAASFGGGGHARAAGLRAQEPLDTLKAKVIQAVLKEF